MIDLTVTIIFSIIMAILTYVYTKFASKKLLLPTCPGYPIIGSITYLDKNRPDKTFLKWGEELGPVYAVKLLHETIVVVSGYDELNEMLITKGNSFAGRQRRSFLADMFAGYKDLVFADANESHWMSLRKAAHRGIRHYGAGLTRLETLLSIMSHEFIEKLSTYEGKPIDMRDDIYNFVLKVAISMISGQAVAEDKDNVLIKLKNLEQLTTNFAPPPIGVELEIFPWLKYFGHPLVKEIKKMCSLRDELWDEMWRESQQTYSSDGEATCIMHSIAQLTDKNSQHYSPLLSKDNAKGLFSDIILASIITTSNFSYVLPSILLHYKDVQKRLQEEVDTVVGSGRHPSIFDRDQMPYTAATVYELLRYASLVATLPHAALETVTLGGYTIPAGTVIFPYFPAILHDKKFWGDPEVFRPERFLDESGNLLPADHPNRKHMLQFGAGPRVCVGEAFALKRLFIFTASLVQKFDLQQGDKNLVPCDYDSYETGSLLHHKPYKVRLVAR